MAWTISFDDESQYHQNLDTMDRLLHEAIKCFRLGYDLNNTTAHMLHLIQYRNRHNPAGEDITALHIALMYYYVEHGFSKRPIPSDLAARAGSILKTSVDFGFGLPGMEIALAGGVTHAAAKKIGRL